jgi:hypothetical protein
MAGTVNRISAAGHRTILSGKDHGQLPFSVDSRRGVLAWPIMRFVAWNLLTLSTPIGRKMAPLVRKGGEPLAEPPACTAPALRENPALWLDPSSDRRL